MSGCLAIRRSARWNMRTTATPWSRDSNASACIRVLGEFILGYPDEDGPAPKLPQPEILSRNGSYMAYRRLQQHVAAFRDLLREQGGPTTDEQELLAAKLMGRWRSGAPLVLAPDKDDPSLADDPQRNNDFNYAKAANPTKDKGPACFHDGKRRRLFLPSKSQRASLPRSSRQLVALACSD